MIVIAKLLRLTSFSLVNLTSITVALDYAECVDMSLRFDLMSAKLVLSF
jgi:hypothetical protein